MNYIEDIRNGIEELAKQAINDQDNTTSLVGTIISIDTQNTCTVQPIDSTRTIIQNILLSSDSGSAPSFVPAIGTTVVVTLFSNTSGYIAQHGKLASVALAPGTQNYGGICIVADVVTRLNLIENAFNTFISSVYNVHTHVVASAPGTSATPIPQDTNSLQLTQSSDIENTVVTHGNGSQPNTAHLIDILNQQKTVDAATYYTGVLLSKLNDAEITLNSINNIEDTSAYKQAQSTYDSLNVQYDKAFANQKKQEEFLNSLKQNTPH